MEFCGPGGVDEADVDEVSEVGAVFIAEVSEVGLDEGVEVEDAEEGGVGGIGDVGVGDGFFGADFFVGEDDVDAGAWGAGGAVEEEFHIGGVAVDEAGLFQSVDDGGKLFAFDEEINILRITDAGFVDGGDPCGDGISTGDGVGDVGVLQGGGGTK